MRKIVINLSHRTDRRAAMEAELARVGWQAEFFPAIRPESSAGFPSIGARGCFLSHLTILRQARSSSAEHLVVMEDDLNFDRHFTERWPEALTALTETKGWSLFYPGHTLGQMRPGLSQVPHNAPIQCTHFMIFNREALDKIIAGLELILSRPPGHPLGGPMHVDGAYSTIREQNPALTTLCHTPSLGYQRPSKTDIGHQKWFDRIGSLQRVVQLGRRLKSVIHSDRPTRS